MTDCIIITPNNSGIEPACELALSKLEAIGYPVWRVRGYSAIDQGRCQLATDALAQGFSETLWIDSDIGFEPEDVQRIRSHNLPLACAVYPQKGRRALAASTLAETDKVVFGSAGGLMELRYAGAGFLHVRREVYTTMIDKLDLPICNARFGRTMYPFFLPLVIREHWQNAPNEMAADSPAVTNAFHPVPTPKTAHDTPDTSFWYLAEDYAFCERARRCGFKIMADTSIRLRHFGSYGYTWEDAGNDPVRYESYEFRVRPPT